MITAFFGVFYETEITLETQPLLMALLLFPVIVWKWLKPLLEAKKETNLYKRGLKKIKNNPNVFRSLLEKSRTINTNTEGLGISLKSKNANFNVIKVCNPYCDPCAKAHPILEELYNMGKINLQILFTANPDNNDPAIKPVRQFLAINANRDMHTIRKALDDWYLAEKKDYEVFAQKYPMNGELRQQDEKIEAMKNWCDVEKITHTPTIFINDHELPKEYNLEDLKEVLA